LFPAATEYVTPDPTERQIAECRASALVLPQLPSSWPTPPRLIFATRTLSKAEFAVTKSMPQMTEDQVPVPAESRTFTAIRRTPGTTPTTPAPSFFAPMIPATWVPWPLSSWADRLESMQFFDVDAKVRSG